MDFQIDTLSVSHVKHDETKLQPFLQPQGPRITHSSYESLTVLMFTHRVFIHSATIVEHN